MKSTRRVLLVCVGLLLMLGLVALNAVALSEASSPRLRSQGIWMSLGLVVALGMALTDYRWLRRSLLRPHAVPARLEWAAGLRVSHVLLGLAVLQLVLLLVPGLSEVRNGARRWPIWGGQPSEFAKLALIIALADSLARRPSGETPRLGTWIWPATCAGGVALLIFVEPDWGGALVTVLIAAAMLFVAGARWFHLISALLILGLLSVHALLADPHRLGRVLAFANPEQHQDGAGFQQWRSLLAVASGGWFGRLIGEGDLGGGFVPEQDTDFVFSLLAEGLGFVGVLMILTLYGAVVLCGLRIASRGDDLFGRYAVCGITVWIGVQSMIHVAVNTSLLPNKGLPLPLISAGGSNLVCLLAGLGFVLSVARFAPRAALPDPNLAPANPWLTTARRLWELVRRPAPPSPRHAYQLPPAKHPRILAAGSSSQGVGA